MLGWRESIAQPEDLVGGEPAGQIIDKLWQNCHTVEEYWAKQSNIGKLVAKQWQVLVLAARSVDSADGGLNNPPRIFDLSSRSTLITLLLMMMVISDFSLDHPSASIPEQARGSS